jgi:hypothetical protein
MLAIKDSHETAATQSSITSPAALVASHPTSRGGGGFAGRDRALTDASVLVPPLNF